MKELNKLFRKIVKIYDKLGEELCLDTIVQCPTENTMFASYTNEVYYIYSGNGTISNTSPFTTWCLLRISKESNEDIYGFEDMFKWYCGKLKEQMIKNTKENKGVSIINFFDCENGKFNYSIEIFNEEEFKKHLIEDMAILDYGYTEEEIDKWLNEEVE